MHTTARLSIGDTVRSQFECPLGIDGIYRSDMLNLVGCIKGEFDIQTRKDQLTIETRTTMQMKELSVLIRDRALEFMGALQT